MDADRLRRHARDRGVSPVIGVVLMTAIVVLLAAVVASVAFGFENELQEPAPTGGFDYDFVPSGEGNTDNRPYVNITHQVGETVDGDNIVIKDDSGNSVTWENVWTGGPEVHANEFVHIDGFGSDSALDPICEEGQTYSVIVQNDDGTTLILTEWTAPVPPDIPPGPPHNSGDGTPTWC
jgi:flagellin-like protein